MSQPIKMLCRKAMWSGFGTPAGICGAPAYGPEPHMRDRDEYWTEPKIARCHLHGGPSVDEFGAWLKSHIDIVEQT